MEFDWDYFIDLTINPLLFFKKKGRMRYFYDNKVLFISLIPTDLTGYMYNQALSDEYKHEIKNQVIRWFHINKDPVVIVYNNGADLLMYIHCKIDTDYEIVIITKDDKYNIIGNRNGHSHVILNEQFYYNSNNNSPKMIDYDKISKLNKVELLEYIVKKAKTHYKRGVKINKFNICGKN